jgi:hypothetical protein
MGKYLRATEIYYEPPASILARDGEHVMHRVREAAWRTSTTSIARRSRRMEFGRSFYLGERMWSARQRLGMFLPTNIRMPRSRHVDENYWVDKDLLKARTWLESSASRGFPAARTLLHTLDI